jgi:hypothetical protein
MEGCGVEVVGGVDVVGGGGGGDIVVATGFIVTGSVGIEVGALIGISLVLLLVTLFDEVLLGEIVVPFNTGKGVGAREIELFVEVLVVFVVVFTAKGIGVFNVELLLVVLVAPTGIEVGDVEDVSIFVSSRRYVQSAFAKPTL